MTFSRQPLRGLKSYVQSKSDPNSFKNRTIGEGIIVEKSDTDKLVKVKVLPENHIAIARVAMNKASSNTQDGSMPDEGTHVLLFFLSNVENIYEDIVVFGEIFDKENTPPSRTSGAEDDPFYHSITPKNGGKIELYKDSEDKQRLYITGLGQIDIKATDDLNIISNNVSLGEADLNSDADKLVKQPHLQKHDDFISAVTLWINAASPTVIAAGLLTGVPVPLLPSDVLVYNNSSTAAKENGTNKTSKVRAK